MVRLSKPRERSGDNMCLIQRFAAGPTKAMTYYGLRYVDRGRR